MSSEFIQDNPQTRSSGERRSAKSARRSGKRVLVLDVAPPWMPRWQRISPRLLILDIESGRVAAEARTGSLPEVAVSKDGALIAVVSDRSAEQRKRLPPHLTVFDADDLSVLADRSLPFDYRFRRFPHFITDSTFCFSPDNEIILVLSPCEPGAAAEGQVEQGFAYYVPIDWKGRGGRSEVFSVSRNLKTCSTPFEGANPILSTNLWPRVAVGDRNHNAVVMLDLSSGGPGKPTRLFELLPPLKDGRVEHPGYLVPMHEGDTAVFVPETERPSPLRTVGLSNGEPRVLKQSQKFYGDLQRPFAASERLLFAAPCPVDETPQEVRMLDLRSLAPAGSINAGISYKSLHAAHDGSTLYAISWSPPSITAIDPHNGTSRRYLEGMATGPLTLFPLNSGGRG